MSAVAVGEALLTNTTTPVKSGNAYAWSIVVMGVVLMGVVFGTIINIFSASEDFSEFTNRVPGVFALLNAGDESDGLPFQNHHPKFNIREDVLDDGVAFEVQLVLDRLGTA